MKEIIENSKGTTKNWVLFTTSWEGLKGQWGICIGFVVLQSLIAFASSFLYVSIFISGVLHVGAAVFFLNVSRKTNPNIEDMFKGFNNSYLAALGSSLLVMIYVFVGFFLLIIPGIIWGIQYSMVPFIIADNPNCGGNEALVRSRKMMYGHKWKYFRFTLRVIGIILLGYITCGVGLLWAIPWIMVATAKFYDDIK